MTIKKLAHKAFRQSGYDFMRYDAHHFPSVIKKELIESERIDLVVDVGAHEGHYVADLRDTGYRGSVISFEPQSQSFPILEERARKDGKWLCIRAAVGEERGETEIFISGRKTSSSLLPIEETHVHAVPASAVVTTERVAVETLDSYLGREIRPDRRIFLKIDVQGYEMYVLKGATRLLEQVRALEVELSFVPLYRGAPLFNDMVAYMESLGFVLVSLEHVLRDPDSGRLLQVDGLFRRLEG